MMLALPAAAAENSVWSIVPDTTSAELAAFVSWPKAEPGCGMLSSSRATARPQIANATEPSYPLPAPHSTQQIRPAE